MDIFYEYLIKREKTGKDKILSVLYIAAAVLLTFIFMFILGYFLRGFELLLVVGVWYGAVQLIRRSDVEYEYILTNSVLDIDRIIAKKRRKRIISIDFKTIEKCEPKQENAAGSIPNAKVLDLTADINGANVYYVDFSKGSEQYRVYFQPNEKILSGLKNANPRFVSVEQNNTEDGSL